MEKDKLVEHLFDFIYMPPIREIIIALVKTADAKEEYDGTLGAFVNGIKLMPYSYDEKKAEELADTIKELVIADLS